MIKAANLTGAVSRKAGGLFESVRRLAQSLAETGMDVRVFGTQDEYSAEDLPAWAPVLVSVSQPTWPEQFGYSRSFLKGLEEFGPDVTHTHGIWLYPGVATNYYCRHKGVPYLISAHGMLDPWAIRHGRWKKAIAYFLYESAHLRGARCLRALCEAEARAIRQVGLKNPIAILPNGIDIPREQTTGDPPWVGRLEPDQKVLLYLGRIHPKKGLPNLLKALAGVARDGHKDAKTWTVAIAGWDQGGHEGELKKTASELGISWKDVRDATGGRPSANAQGGSLLFLGPQFNAAKEACYRHCDAFVLPSFSEGVPMAVLEAWACAKPVLITPQCNLEDGFTCGAGVRVDPEPQSIERGLRQLWETSQAERAAMGQRGYELVSRTYAWPKIAERMGKLYEWMLGGGAAPDCLADF